VVGVVCVVGKSGGWVKKVKKEPKIQVYVCERKMKDMCDICIRDRILLVHCKVHVA